MTQRDAAGRSETQRGAAQSSATQRDAAGRKGEGVSLPRRVCRALLCAMLVRHARVSEQARKNISPKKIHVTSKPPVGGISVVTLIRTDTTLDHSQKAEKV